MGIALLFDDHARDQARGALFGIDRFDGDRVGTLHQIFRDVVDVEHFPLLARADQATVDVEFITIVARDLNRALFGRAEVEGLAEVTSFGRREFFLVGGRPDPLRLFGAGGLPDHEHETTRENADDQRPETCKGARPRLAELSHKNPYWQNTGKATLPPRTARAKQ